MGQDGWFVKRFAQPLLHAPLLRWIRQGTPLLLILGLAFLLVAIWWLGPLWSWREERPLASLSVRLLVTIALLMAPVLVWALALRRRNRRLEAERQQEAKRQEDPGLRFVQAQERSLDRSLATLRVNLRGSNALYRLPWYLVLGPEQSGKTSFINRSSQKFSLTGEVKAGGRHVFEDPDLVCSIDWWMSSEAVLIDPPGDMISHPRATDEARYHPRLWEHLIDWLSRNRSRRPLNGVVLIVDLVTLLSQPPSDRKALAILLRTRLCELSRQLGTRPPLYVVLSKFDLVEGFEAFFTRLPKSVKEDIFGFTFTLDCVQDYDAWLTELAERYDALIARLNERIFDALSAAIALEEREGLFSLVRQLAGMRQILLGFLSDVLGSDRYITPALPRGVYFSSVYQQGLLTNAFVTSAAQTYALEAQVSSAQPSGRSVVYFAQQLFQRVIYPEAGLAGDNLKVLADKKRALALSVAVAGLGGLVLIAGWYHFYAINRDKAVIVLDRSRAFSAHAIDGSADPTGRNLLQPLDQIRSAVSVYGDYRDAWPLVADLGLYQGRDIGPKVDEAYLKLLSQRFLPALAGGVMTMMTAPEASDGDRLAALRVYRMIEDRRNRRTPIVEEWMGKRWQTAFAGENAVQSALMSHLDYAMKYADADLPQYRAQLSRIQSALRQIPMPQRVYMTLRRQAGLALRTPLDLRNEIGPAFDVVYKSKRNDAQGASTMIDALMTAKGYSSYFEPHSRDLSELAMIDQWALGERRNIDYSEADRQALSERIREIYSRDYIDSWQRSLNQLEVRDFSDIAQAVSVLASVTGPTAPLRRLVETVRDNSEPGEKPDASAIQAGAMPLDVSIVRAFAPLSEILAAKGNRAPYLDETMLAIGSVQEVVKSVQDSPDRGKAALGFVLERFALKGPDVIGNLQRIAAGLPAPLDRQVKKLADESSQVLLIEGLRELDRRWEAEVFRFYNEQLANRYPFNPASRDEVSLDDFTAFFGPQGRLQQFKDQYLKLFFQDNLEALYSERRGGSLVRSDILEQLASAERIGEAFFNARGTLGVQFVVEPLGLTPTRRSAVLNLEGQLIAYSHGATNSTGLIWPNSLSNSNESRITLVNGGGNSSSLVYRGPWSMFRLLSQARLNGRTANSVDLSFAADDGAMRYRITAEKSNNPFTQALFRNFTLPRTLLQEHLLRSAAPSADPAIGRPARNDLTRRRN